MNPRMRTAAHQAGLSMIELMIAITIGLLILAGLVTVFANASNAQHELRRTAQQIENGRYAIDVLTQDLQLAGFWGHFRKYTTPSVLPDPCSVDATDLKNAMGLPVQGSAAADKDTAPTPPGTCATLLPAANLALGSDILVVRRAHTDIPATGSAVAGEHYVQANPSDVAVQIGAAGGGSCTLNAAGVASTIFRRCSIPAASDICGTGVLPCATGGSPAAFVRKYEVHVYFVAPCNVPTGGGSICTGASDDNGRPIPTLKRLELSAGTFRVVPLAEGVEYMKVSYGVDDTSTAGTNVKNSETELVGDGSPDRYVHAPSLADFSNAVTARVDLLVRNPEPSSGYSDPKTYHLGVADGAAVTALFPITPSQPQYRRHAYSSEIRLVNLGGRKEIP